MSGMMKRGATTFVLEENVDRLNNTAFNPDQYEEFFNETETSGLINYIVETAEAHRQVMLQDVRKTSHLSWAPKICIS